MHEGRRIAFLIPGQGSQQPRMAVGLYRRDPVFTDVMDTAFRLLGDAGPQVRAEWLAEAPSPMYDDVTCAQPLLYAVGYALAEMLLSRGARPAALLGHSVGEMVAATLAGVIGFQDGVGLIRDRMRQFAGSAPGGMLAVAASAAEIAPYVTETVALAAINANRQTLLAGERRPLAQVARALKAEGFFCRPVDARQAFHSPVVEDAAVRSLAAWRSVPLAPPTLALYSAYLGDLLPPETAVDPVFWAMQPVRTVLFWPTLCRLLTEEDLLLVEAGPGQTLCTLARRHPSVRSGRSVVVPLLPARAGDEDADRNAVRDALRRIAAEGHAMKVGS